AGPTAARARGAFAGQPAREWAGRCPWRRQPGGAGGAGGVRHVALVVITSNRGLAGAFNANLIREGRRRIEQLESEGATVDLHLIGKKGITYFKFAKRPIASQRVDIGDKPTAAHAADVVNPLMAQFEAGAVDAVEVVFPQFKSAV